VVQTWYLILECVGAHLYVGGKSYTLACVPFPSSSLRPVKDRHQLLAHVQLTGVVAETTTNPRAVPCTGMCGRLQLFGPNTCDQGQQQEKHTLHRDIC
jgi:hypothetical protein